MADLINDEAGYLLSLVNFIEINLNRHKELTEINDLVLRDKFVIIGRVEPEQPTLALILSIGQYINVGTHGVVLDTILSESFIVPLGFGWSILLL